VDRFSQDELRSLGELLARANDPSRDDPTGRT
jgi:hypothetical protein